MSKNSASKEQRLYDAIQMTRPLLRHITAAVDSLSLAQGISVGERAILEGLLGEGPMTAPQLTQKLQLKRQFVARILAEVKARGLVVVKPNPGHKRSVFYTLSETGQSRITAIRGREMDRVKEFCRQFKDQEIEAYYNLQSSLTDWFAELENWKGKD